MFNSLRQIKRLYFFKKQFPLHKLANDALFLPYDYYCTKGRSSRLRYLNIIVTNQCNQRCSWCFYKRELNNRQEFPLNLYNQLIDDVYKERPAIQLSGGEPFLNRDIFLFIKKAKEHELPVSVFTNGALLNKERINRLIDLRLDYLCISVIGPKDVHEAVTATKSYETLINNLEYLKDVDRMGTKLILNITLSRDMVKNLVYIDELITKYRIDGLRFQHLNFLYPDELRKHKDFFAKAFDYNLEIHQTSNVDEYRLNDLHAIDNFIAHSKVAIQQAPPLSIREMKQWYLEKIFTLKRKCIFPWRGVQIGADGNVYPCYKIYYPFGNLRETGFYGIWNNDKYRAFRLSLKKKLFPGCARCCKL